MRPGLYSPTIYQGEDWSRSFTFADSSSHPIDLTTYTAAEAEIREKAGGDLLLTYSLDSGLTVGGSGNATLIWVIGHADTATLATGHTLRYDLWLTDASGNRNPYLAGSITVASRITEIA